MPGLPSRDQCQVRHEAFVSGPVAGGSSLSEAGKKRLAGLRVPDLNLHLDFPEAVDLDIVADFE
jgi:hypothetical protein